MRSRLTHAITVGLSLAGCSDRSIASDASEGGGTGSTGTDTSGGEPLPTTVATLGDSTSTSTTQSADSDGEVEAETAEPPKFDLAAAPDIAREIPMLDCEAPPPTASCSIGPPDADIEWVRVCIPPDAGGQCSRADAAPVWLAVDECLDSMEWTGSGCGGGAAPDCATVIEDDLCCYWKGFTGWQCPGRPFLVDGRERIAPLQRRDDWRAQPQAPAAHDTALAEAWLFDARNEHAAIASFSRFAMQLLALAAPPRFVEQALRAASDEREHAMLFFAFAHAHGSDAYGPGPLDITGALADTDEIAIVVATVREGCIAETISAMQLHRAATLATDPQRRAALERVLAQELQHVELAWSFVAWAYARGDEALRTAVIAAFEDAERCIPRGPDVDPTPDELDRWHEAGRLSRRELHAIALHTLHTLVRASAAELLVRASVSSPDATLCSPNIMLAEHSSSQRRQPHGKNGSQNVAGARTPSRRSS